MRKVAALLLGSLLALGSLTVAGPAPTARAAVEDGKNLVDNRGFGSGNTAGWTCQSCTIAAQQWNTRQSGAWSASVYNRTGSASVPAYSLLGSADRFRQ